LSDDTFYVTTPIYYINDVPHLGNAYPTVVADFIARFRRLQGRPVFFLTGTDEHGVRIARTAESKGLAPKDWADQIVPRWHAAWKALDISYDDFIRTTEERHERPVQQFVQALYDRDEVYLGSYEGLYCVGCEAFKQPDELVEGKCPLHGVEPELVEEDNYFFRLSKYRDRLIEVYETDERFVMPEIRRNEVLGKVRQGLQDLSISRVSFDWGIPVPWDSRHVIYVWVDALQNYITAAGYGSDEDRFETLWPADVHLIGKDIVWFHAVIWPAMLMALDLPLPRTVFAHGFLLVGGEKMSKSRATGISPQELIETFGSDGYRYYFLREVSFGHDGTFSWESMVARYNSDLANDLGNLASRVITMIGRYLKGTIPDPPSGSELTGADEALIATHREALDDILRAVDAIAPHDALKAAWRFVRKANAYVEEITPWTLARDSGQTRRLEVVLYNLAESLRLISLMVFAATPHAAQELWGRLGLEGRLEDARLAPGAPWGALPAGSRIRQGEPLWPRLQA
jgi:methionyl-tRNA synthetase